MKRTFSFVLIVLLAIAALNAESHDNEAHGMYLNPRPNSISATPGHTITFRSGKKYSNETLKSVSFKVTGEKSGRLDGEIILASDYKTLIFKPAKPFEYGEKVHVEVLEGDNTFTEYEFRITQKPAPAIKMDDGGIWGIESPAGKSRANSLMEAIAPGIPEINITKYDNPMPGYFFFTPFNIPDEYFGIYPDVVPSMVIMDNYGTPIFYRIMDTTSPVNYGLYADFKMLDNGMLIYNTRFNTKYYMMDSSYTVIDSFSTGNGYPADMHDFQLLPNGNYLMVSYAGSIIDASELIEGGNPELRVLCALFQELDKDGNVIFEWNSLDYIDITDTRLSLDGLKDTTGAFDYAHINSIELDSDTSYIMSCRHLDEVTRISRNTGEIIWRLGSGKGNQFEFISEVDGEEPEFYVQHDARKLPNGNITLFDNGDMRDPRYSRACEYEIDEENMTATLVKCFRANPDSFGLIMGSCQTFDNGRRVAGWGSGRPNVTEFKENGETALEIDFAAYSYRGFKYEWETNVVIPDTKEIVFDKIEAGQEAPVKTVKIRNNSADVFTVNNILNNHPKHFTCLTELPLEIQPGEAAEFEIQYWTPEEGIHEDVFTFCQDKEMERIATQVKVSGQADNEVSVEDGEDKGISLYISPNPAKTSASIYFSSGNSEEINFRITNITGSVFYEKKLSPAKQGINKFTINTSRFPAGTYIVSTESAGRVNAVKLIVAK